MAEVAEIPAGSISPLNYLRNLAIVTTENRQGSIPLKALTITGKAPRATVPGAIISADATISNGVYLEVTL